MPKKSVSGPLVMVKDCRTGSNAMSPSAGWALRIWATNTVPPCPSPHPERASARTPATPNKRSLLMGPSPRFSIGRLPRIRYSGEGIRLIPAQGGGEMRRFGYHRYRTDRTGARGRARGAPHGEGGKRERIAVRDMVESKDEVRTSR